MTPSTGSYARGQIIIKRGAYIGANTIICKPVTIGENAIIGAGSIITKDIPANEVWAGNPAKFIRKR
ncbi:acyltransferase [Muribaculum intestinale]|nr:DapH/DapD/GlmU-related protein [Muribaculum intestinale]